MHWTVLLVTSLFYFEFVSTWNSSKVNCKSSLECLLLKTHPRSINTNKTTAPREINTWHPIPKWKVFNDSKKNRNEYAAHYFNRQNLGRADGNTFFHGNEFRTSKDLKRDKVSEILKIQFFPLNNENITIEKFGRKINNISSEYVALFVVYVDAKNNGILTTKTFVYEDEGQKFNILLENENNNGNWCNGEVSCKEHNAVFVQSSLQNSSTYKNKPYFEEFKIISIPVTKNMIIDVKTGQNNNNSYTVKIIPARENVTAMEYEVFPPGDDELINIHLTKNMSVTVKSEDNFNYKFINGSDNANISEAIELVGATALDIEEELKDNHTDATEDIYLNKQADKQNESKKSFTTAISDIVDDTDISTVEMREINNNYITEKFDFKLDDTKGDTTVSNNLDNKKFEKELKNGSYIANSGDTYNATTVDSQPESKLFKFEFSEKFGPYEVKKLNSSNQPFIATIHIKISNKDAVVGRKILLFPKHNTSSSYRETSSNKIAKGINETLSNFERIKRNIRFVKNEGYFDAWQRLRKEISDKENYMIKNRDNSNSNSNGKNDQLPRMKSDTTEVITKKVLINNTSITIPTKRKCNSTNLFNFIPWEDFETLPALSNSNKNFRLGRIFKMNNKQLASNKMPSSVYSGDAFGNMPNDQNISVLFESNSLTGMKLEKNYSTLFGKQIINKMPFNIDNDNLNLIYLLRNSTKQHNLVTPTKYDLKDRRLNLSNIFNVMDSEKKLYDVRKKRDLKSNKEERGKLMPERGVNSKRLNKVVRHNKMHPNNFDNNLGKNALFSNQKYSNPSSLYFSDWQRDKYHSLKLPFTDIGTKREDTSNIIGQKQGKGNKMNITASKYRNKNEPVERSRNNLYSDDKSKLKMFKKYLDFIVNSLKISTNTLMRSKRSISSLPSDPETTFYLMTLNTPSLPVFPRIIVRNASSASNLRGNKQNEMERQKFLFNLIQNVSMFPKLNPRKFPDVSRTQNRNNGWIRRFKWSQNNRRIPGVHESVFLNGVMPDYDWIVIIPEGAEVFADRNIMSKPTKPPIIDKKMEHEPRSTNPDREREDDDANNTEWVRVDKTRKIEKMYIRTTQRPKEKKPLHIVNRKPEFTTTTRTPSEFWVSNGWKVSKNPWKTIVTTPMMMMGMGAGD